MARWTKRLLIGGGALVLVVGAGVVYLLASDTTTPVEVEDAVGRYREEQTSSSSTTAPSAAPVLPDPGVYVYATEGSERIDILGGATHEYPSETTITVAHTDCGVRQRWTPIEERNDDEELCRTDDGLERQSLRTHHEFFNLGDDQEFTCSPGYLVVPADPVAGATWTTECTAGDTVLTGQGQVVGFEDRTVGGETVATVHVRIEETASGSDDGTSSDDYWLRRSDGLLIERASTVQTRSSSPVGTATYDESFTLQLLSLTPRT